MTETTYTHTDMLGEFDVSIRNCTEGANRLLASGWNNARIESCKTVFVYVHGHTEQIPIVDMLALVRSMAGIEIECTYGDYSYTIDAVPSIPSLLSFYEELIEDADSFTIQTVDIE